VRKRARAAYVPQDSRFADGLTIRQVLEAALAAAHVNEGEREGRLREFSGRAGFLDLDAKPLGSPAAEQAAGDYRGSGFGARSDAARRAHQPPRSGGHRMAGRAAELVFIRRRHRQPRPLLLESTSSEIIELNRVFADGLCASKATSAASRRKAGLSRIAEPPAGEPAQPGENRDRMAPARPKARTSKSKARIDTANAMIGQLAELNARTAVNTAASTSSQPAQDQAAGRVRRRGYSIPTEVAGEEGEPECEKHPLG